MKRTRVPTQRYIAEAASRKGGCEFASPASKCVNCFHACDQHSTYCKPCFNLRETDSLFLHRAHVSVRCTDQWYDGIVQDVRIESYNRIAHKIYYPLDGDVQWHILSDEEYVCNSGSNDCSAKYDANVHAKKKTCADQELSLPDVESHKGLICRLLKRSSKGVTLKRIRRDLEKELCLTRNALKPQKAQIAAIVNAILDAEPLVRELPLPAMQERQPSPIHTALEREPALLAPCAQEPPSMQTALEQYPLLQAPCAQEPPLIQTTQEPPKIQTAFEREQALPAPCAQEPPPMQTALEQDPLLQAPCPAKSPPMQTALELDPLLQAPCPAKSPPMQTALELETPPSSVKDVVFFNAIAKYLSSKTATELAVHFATHNVSNKFKRSIVYNLGINEDMAKAIESSSPAEVCTWSPDDMKTKQRLAEDRASRASYQKWRTIVEVADVHAGTLESGCAMDEEGPVSPPPTYGLKERVSTELSTEPLRMPPTSNASYASRAAELEKTLVMVLMQDPDRSRMLWDKSSRLRHTLLDRVKNAGGDAATLNRAIVAAYRNITFKWSTEERRVSAARGVSLFGVRMHRPH